MKFQIDNFDGAGLRDYTAAIDGVHLPEVVRKLNQPSELRVNLLASTPDFVVPAAGARVLLGLTNGQDVFTGYLTDAPAFEYLGWGGQGPMFRYSLMAKSDEVLLDQKRVPDIVPFVERSAGSALRQLTEDVMGSAIDLSAAQNLDNVAGYAGDPQKTWSQHAAELAVQARACYRLENGALSFAPLGANVYTLSESDANFSPPGLKLAVTNAVVNDVTRFV